MKELGFLLPGEVLPESNPRATAEDSGEVGDKVDVYPAGKFILLSKRTRIYRVPLTLVFSSLAPFWRWWVTASSFGKGTMKDSGQEARSCLEGDPTHFRTSVSLLI